jgi:molybdopterin-containing oxidoreductase family molybdopterin binding subunit
MFEKYPFMGISNHGSYFAHSAFTQIPWLDELSEPFVEINTDAAAERNIFQGDLVRVFNDRGFVVLKAVTTNGIRPDTVLLPHGWQGFDFVAGHSQDLTRIDMDPVTVNSAFYEFLCDVEKYDGSAVR